MGGLGEGARGAKCGGGGDMRSGSTDCAVGSGEWAEPPQYLRALCAGGTQPGGKEPIKATVLSVHSRCASLPDNELL